MKKIIAVVTTFALAVVMTSSVAFASSSESNIGNGQGTGLGLDLNAYCSHIGKGNDSSVISGTQDWTCSATGAGDPISLHDACQYENPGHNSVKEEVKGNPYTWNCFK